AAAAPVRPRTRSRPQSLYLGQASPNRASKPQQSLYRQPNRPSLLSNYAPAQQSLPKPTSRPSSPETFTYTEQPQDDFGNTDFSDQHHHHHHSSQSPGFDGSLTNSFSGSTLSLPSSQSFQPSGSPSAGYTSATGTGSSSSTNQGSFRSTSSRYPTRSLGIPIASFRVAPASSFTGSSAGVEAANAEASSIHQVRMGFTNMADDDILYY
ncbi:hypothetical protein BLA29_007190, partial [Euroglyphus maynei]